MAAEMKALEVKRRVRPMELGDIPQVERIEREAFPTTWPPTSFHYELRQNRIARYLVAVEAVDRPTQPPLPVTGTGLGRLLEGVRDVLLGGREATQGQTVTGYVGLWLPAYEAHIVAIAVREAQRRQGIGEMLLQAALELAASLGRSLVTLECRVSNQPALALYHKYGFQRVGVRPRYYSDNQEDAYVLNLEGVDTPAYQSRLRELKEQHRQRWGEYEISLRQEV